jgi:3-mercaptopyruvate sulfurtransferase SseA
VTVYFRTVEELERVPDHAVLLDSRGMVWQRYQRDSEWLTPGDDWGHGPNAIHLPAQLLHDGI